MSLQSVLQIPQQENANCTFALAVGNIIAAKHIRKNTRDKERQKKIDGVLQIKEEALAAFIREKFDEPLKPIRPDRVASRISHWEQEWKDLLLIDLIFASPFAPYEIKSDEKEKEIGLQPLALALGVPISRYQSMCAARREAIKVHRQVDWLRLGVISAGAIAICAAGGWLAAPMLGSAIGTAAGLSGAAAVAHGLALLGGGALAAGGAGMAGGVWLVAGVSAAVGGGLAGSSTLFFQLGAQAMRVEILKFEAVFKSVILTQQQATALAKQSIAELQQHLETLEGKLTVERSLNEKKSVRVQELEEKMGTIEKALKWMRKQSA
jgi:hypothetical protein